MAKVSCRQMQFDVPLVYTCVVTVPLMATCTRRAYRLPQVLCGWNASDFPNLPNIQVLLGQ